MGFCVMRKDTYENKLSDTLDSNQFSKSKGTSDAIVLKIERDINEEKRRNKLESLHKDEVYWGAARQALWVGESG